MIRRFLIAVLFVSGFFSAIFAASSPARAEDPSYLTVSGGFYDIDDTNDNTGEFRLEYRSNKKLYNLKPFAAISATASGSAFIGAGVLMDIYFGRRFVLTPSFAPHLWHQGGSDKDLGYALEFRSQLEAAYRFDDRSRLGVAFSHYSNASLGDRNPGVETLSVTYSVPIDKLFSK